MKVYASHQKIQEFLKGQNLPGIYVVDTPKESHYMITGRYKQIDYHENLRGIIIPYTGHNGIDLKEMKEKELKLFITPTRSRYVAEKAVALTLTLLGNLLNYHQLLKEGNWAERNSDSRTPWNTIQGKTIGLFGYGRIGVKIHEMFRGFGCEFYTIDRNKEYPSDMNTVKNLTNLVQMSDIIIIAAPLNETTESMFDQQLLNRMKKKYLINIGRGKIVEEEALYNALKEGRLKGYASDVWFNYPIEKELCHPSFYPIHELDNVVMSNHSGGYTVNTNKEVNDDLIKMLKKLQEENFEDQLNLENLL